MMRNFSAWLSYLAAREAMAHAWWGNDCVTYARGAVIALGGADPLAGIAPWTDEASAQAVLNGEGGLEAAVSRRLRRLDGPAHAMRGDIGLALPASGAPFLVVVEGRTICGPGLTRARHLPRALMTVAWSAL